MSRLWLLLIFLLWFAWPGSQEAVQPGTVTSGPATGLPEGLAWQTALFLGFYLALVIVMGLWSRGLADRISTANLRRSGRWFNRMISLSRAAVPIWFGVGVFVLGWGHLVRWALGPVAQAPLQMPGAILATLPAMAAWAGLWWSQFPADRALREHSLLIQLDDGGPVHPLPTLSSYIRSNLRLQILFTAVPILLILLVHDAVLGTLWGLGLVSAQDQLIQALASLAAATVVLLLSPEILGRVLHTQRLPDSPLRRRLEQMCQRHGLAYRQILLWRTGGTMGNAAVMGILPRLRYILLSDLLLESMTDHQIEAVFAHELGHIVHRHMSWYVIFFLALLLLAAGPGEWAAARLDEHGLPAWLPLDLVMTLGGLAAFLAGFGFVSRRFERQADVFAARSIGHLAQQAAPHIGELQVAQATVPVVDVPVLSSSVGPYGAHMLASALHRVAIINNMPVRARSWCHGSIARRMDYVRHLGADPQRTARFDQLMSRLNLALLGILFAGAAWLLVQGLWAA